MDPLQQVRSAIPPDVLSRTIAVPAEHQPLRLPSFPNLERTAVLRTRVTQPLTVGAGEDGMALLVRSATFPLWWRQKTTLHQPQSVFLTTLPGVPVATFNTLRSTMSLAGVWGAYTANLPANPYRYLTPSTLPLGVTRDGREFMYWPEGLYVSLEVIYNVASLTEAVVTWEFFDGSESFQRAEQITTTVAATVFSISLAPAMRSLFGSNWVRPVQIAFNTSVVVTVESVSFGVSTDGSLVAPVGSANAIDAFFPISEVPEYRNSELPYVATRPTAVAALFTNVSSVLHKEGTVLAARLPRGLADHSSGVSMYDPVVVQAMPQFTTANAQERYYGPMEKGLYTFTLPDASSEVFMDCTSDYPIYLTPTSGPSSYSAPRFQLEGFDYMSFMQFSDSDATNSTALSLTLDTHLEFRTSSALFNLNFSTIPLESYHTAQMVLARLGVFYENPIHMRVISELVRRGAVAMRPYAVKAAKAVVAAAAPKAVSLTKKAVDAVASKVNKMDKKAKPKPKPKQQASVPKSK